MAAPSSLVLSDGHLAPLARLALNAVTGVPMHLLDNVRVKPASDNWLRAPWYNYKRGGAITVGRTIWFTRKWFAKEDLGDGSVASLWRWLQHLAHEVGHLPQAERFGRSLFGKSQYVLAFAWQYGSRAITLRKAVHDGASLEKEADMGRWVLVQLIGERPLTHPLIKALHGGDERGVREQLALLAARAGELQKRYRAELQP